MRHQELAMNRREFITASLAFALVGCGGSTAPVPVGQFEGAKKYIYDYVPTVVLAGDWQEMGRQYGHLLMGDILAAYSLIAPYKDQYNLGCGKLNSDISNEIYQSYDQRLQGFFAGMAQTSGLSLDQLKLANSIEMVLMFGSGIYSSRCSGLAAWGAYSPTGSLVYGRNYDYDIGLSALNDHIAVTVFHPSNGDIPFAICTWAGCIYASTGINQRGIFVEENDCSGHDKQAAGFYETDGHLNMKAWVRDDAKLLSLLTGAGSMADVDIWMKDNLPIYPHNIGVADAHEARCYQWNIPERIPHAPYVRQADGVMAQTNHYFVVPNGWDLAPYTEQDSSGGPIPGGSIPRLSNLLALAERFKAGIDLAAMCNIMDVSFENGGATVASSLFQVVCQPEIFQFKLKTLKKRNRWVDIPLSSLLFHVP